MTYLYDNIYNKLLSDIKSGVYREGEKLPTEKVLTEKYGVSRVTIQGAMAKLIDDGLIVRIIGKGTFLKTESILPEGDRPARIGLICGISSVYGLQFFNLFERQLSKLNCILIHKNTYNDKNLEARAIKDLISCDIDICVVQPVLKETCSDELLKLAVKGIPLILLDRNVKEVPASFVGTDNFTAMSNALHYLENRGHRRIGFISGKIEDTSTLEDRYLSYKHYFDKLNIPIENMSLFLDANSLDYESGNVYKLEKEKKRIKDFVLARPNFTCFITGEYYISLMAREVLSELNKSVPEDVSLLTFDNIHYYPDRRINSIIQNEERMAGVVVEQVIKLLSKKNDHIKVYCDTVIMENGSVKNLKN